MKAVQNTARYKPCTQRTMCNIHSFLGILISSSFRTIRSCNSLSHATVHNKAPGNPCRYLYLWEVKRLLVFLLIIGTVIVFYLRGWRRVKRLTKFASVFLLFLSFFCFLFFVFVFYVFFFFGVTSSHANLCMHVLVPIFRYYGNPLPVTRLPVLNRVTDASRNTLLLPRYIANGHVKHI